VIAAEVEKVIDALVSKSFSRAEFRSRPVARQVLQGHRTGGRLGDTIDEFSDKQHFLNTVYERFFQGYSVKTADTHGIVYTPQPIVDLMCASVEEVLKSEFGLTLGSPGVNILDRCTGRSERFGSCLYPEGVVFQSPGRASRTLGTRPDLLVFTPKGFRRLLRLYGIEFDERYVWD